MAELLHLSPEEAMAVRLSLRVAFWAMTGSLIPGILVALALARGRFWGKALFDGLIHLPLVLPPVVTGYILLCFLAVAARSASFSTSISASSSPFAGPARHSPAP